jgi:chromodomain-helicase-DNA-binding protein 7
VLLLLAHHTRPVRSSVRHTGQAAFSAKYGDLRTAAQLDALTAETRRYMLRRMKEDVEKSVPPKEETHVSVELTGLQRTYYRALYEKNLAVLHPRGKKACDGPSLMNVAMELRKCCNHPFLLRGVRDQVLRGAPTS